MIYRPTGSCSPDGCLQRARLFAPCRQYTQSCSWCLRDDCGALRTARRRYGGFNGHYGGFVRTPRSICTGLDEHPPFFVARNFLTGQTDSFVHTAYLELNAYVENNTTRGFIIAANPGVDFFCASRVRWHSSPQNEKWKVIDWQLSQARLKAPHPGTASSLWITFGQPS